MFLLLCNFTFQETSFTFNSKNGLKNKLIIVFIKQSHPTKNRTNIFAIMWEPSKSTKSLTFHFRKYDVQSSLFQRSVKILYETFDRNISSNKQLITFYISEILVVGLYQYNSTIKVEILQHLLFSVHSQYTLLPRPMLTASPRQ